MNDQKSYHIYLKDECLFKDITEWEFNIKWRRKYTSYFTKLTCHLNYLNLTLNHVEEQFWLINQNYGKVSHTNLLQV